MRTILILVIILCELTAFTQEKAATDPFVRPLPVPHRAVNDFGKFLTAKNKKWLEKELTAYHTSSGNAIVMTSLDSLTDPKTKKQYTIEQAANLYFNTWGIGDSIKNNGVLLLISRQPRRVRIEVGRGLESVLTNYWCKNIIEDSVVPRFKQELFFEGICSAVYAIEEKLDEPQQAPVTQSATGFTTVYGPVEVQQEGKVNTGSIMGFAVATISLIGVIILIASATPPRVNTVFSGNGYQSGSNANAGYGYRSNDDDHAHNWSSNNDAVAAFSASDSFSSPSSAPSPASTDSYSGGSSDGGGASGSW